MAGDWLYFATDTPEKPEVQELMDATGAPLDAVLGRLLLFWRLVDRHGRPLDEPRGYAVPGNGVQGNADGTPDVTPGSAISLPGVTAGVMADAELGEASRVTGIVPRYKMATLLRNCGGDEIFWAAVAEVGWLVFYPDGIGVPGFEVYFSKSAKIRLQNARRKAECIARKKAAEEETALAKLEAAVAAAEANTTAVIPPDAVGSADALPREEKRIVENRSEENRSEEKPSDESSRVDHLYLCSKEFNDDIISCAKRLFSKPAFAQKTPEDREFLLKIAMLRVLGQLPESCVHDALEALRCRGAGEPDKPVAYITTVMSDWMEQHGTTTLAKLLVGAKLPASLRSGPAKQCA